MTNGSVSLRDIYEMSEKIEAKLDRQHDELMSCIAKNSERITVLENFKTRVMFLYAIACAVIAVAYDYIKSKFFR